MSHVSQCTTVYRSLDDIEAAAKRLGGELIRGKNHITWFGKFVDDSTQWRSMFSAEDVARIDKMSKEKRTKAITDMMGKCHHAIKFKGINYEVGVWENEDGTFNLRFDGYDGALNRKMGGYGGDAFSQSYTIEATKRAARRKGWRTIEKPVASNGSVELEVLVRR